MKSKKCPITKSYRAVIGHALLVTLSASEAKSGGLCPIGE